MADPADAKTYAQPRAEAAGLHWPTYEKQIETESGWAHWSAPGVVKSSPTGSMGLGQLNSRFYAESDWRDPYRNLSKSIEIMAGYLARFKRYREALAAYNHGPGNVGGYTDGAGRVHPAWDGTKEWRCPHEGVVPQCRTAQRNHYLDVILGDGWPEPTAAPSPPPSGILYEDYRDPGPAGVFAARPRGIVLHGSRSGVAGNPRDREYLATARYEQSNPDGLGWHATIGDGKVAVHLKPPEWGWHAKEASKVYLGVEFAQPTVNDPITNEQVAAFADWVKTRVLPAWPGFPLHFPSHAEVDREFGVSQGKTDVHPLGSPQMDDLRARIMRALSASPPVPVEPDYAQPGQVGTGILEMMAEDGTKPAMPSTFLPLGATPAIAEQCWGLNGWQYLFHIPSGRRWRYPPAA